ncbi:MAG: collagen-like protein [Myxococcaceae bacterium]|jgi:hypothetical protein|nr:collagen-like protein [Myxococcaceae bacterium]
MRGPEGAAGPKGDPGQPGAPGMTGPQGVQGPPGQVLVIDGGVVTGPPGASVVVSPIDGGSVSCPNGGVRITQLSDGGVTVLCNGAQGPQGPAGATGATGPQGVAGPQGAQGPTGPQGPSGAVGATGPQGPTGPQGAAGPQGPSGAPGSTGPAGATGPAGPAGPTGAPGPAGPPGATGPAGPPGAVLFLDGGVVLSTNLVTFAGFTAASFTGDLGGYVGANTKCDAEFPGAFLCTRSDYDLADTFVGPRAAGAWVDEDRLATGQRAAYSCTASASSSGAWTYGGSSNFSTGSSGAVISALGTQTTTPCNVSKSLACCRNAGRVVFRGFTVATYTGDLGGYVGANARCHAEFPGSALCTRSDYDTSNTKTGPAMAGAWVDEDRLATGQRAAYSCTASASYSGAWTYGGPSNFNTGSSGAVISALGTQTTTPCNVVKQLACCTRR